MRRVKVKTELDNLTLLELFWTEPIIDTKSGYSCYEITDESNVVLKFGVDIIQESVQLDVRVADNSLITLSYEDIEYIDIIDEAQGKFAFSFSPQDSHLDTNVQIQLRPKIKISGATLTN